jgi:hypothetical protein
VYTLTCSVGWCDAGNVVCDIGCSKGCLLGPLDYNIECKAEGSGVYGLVV